MPFNFYLSALNKYFNLSHCLLVCSDYSSDLNCVYVNFLRDFCSGMPQFMFLVDTFFFYRVDVINPSGSSVSRGIMKSASMETVGPFKRLSGIITLYIASCFS